MSPEKEELKRLAAEDQAIRERIIHLQFAWADLENSLCLLLGTILKDPSNAIASAIYFAPANTETRIAIVSAALRMAIGGSPHWPAIEKIWTTQLNSINRKRGVRNKVAHGKIATVNMGDKNHIRLTAPLFDMFRVGGPIVKGDLPGLSSNDIEQSASAIHTLCERTNLVSRVVDAVFSGNEKSLIEILTQFSKVSATDIDQ